MSFLTILPWVLISVLLSVLAMVYGVSHGSAQLSYWSAMVFAIFIIVLGYLINRRYWFAGPGDERGRDVGVAAARNARLMGVCYIWGAVALMAIYSLTQLRWQHGWQYAAGMAVFGLIGFTFANLLKREGVSRFDTVFRLARWLTIVQGFSAVAGLFYLLGSGIMYSVRDDWAANQVFLFGGIAMVLLSGMSLRTMNILDKRLG